MDSKTRKNMMLTAAECAARIGLSVRALRVYEANGLLSPVRTEKNWRLYGADDIARLNEIMVLKQLGLSLSGISRLLSGQTTDIDRLLAMQETTLAARREQADRSLRLISRLLVKSRGGDSLSMEDLLELAKETQMSDVADEHAWKRYEQARPRTEVEPDRHMLEECAGEYLFDDGIVMRIGAAKNKLRAEVLGQPDFDLFAEAPDSFFLKITPAQVTFSRDGKGRVQSMTLHQGGFEMKAERCPPGTFEKAQSDLKDRIRTRSPLPQSEATLRRLIQEHRSGQPDYGTMSPLLASLVKEQLPMVMGELDRLGPVSGMDFRGVGTDGFDIYVVDFENGRLEWGLAKAANGTVTGLYLRPTP